MGSIKRFGPAIWYVVLICSTALSPLSTRGDVAKLKPLAASYSRSGLSITSLISVPTLNHWGEVSFRAERYDRVNFHNGFGSWSILPNGIIQEIALVGMSAPFAAPDTFRSFSYLSGNGRGQTAFFGSLEDVDFGSPRDVGIWARNEQQEFRLVAREGVPAVGTNKVFAGLAFPWGKTPFQFKTSKQGQVAFTAAAIDPTGNETQQWGVWVEDTSHQLQSIALDNTPVRGYSDGTMFRLMKSSSPSVTDDGKVAFLAYSSGPNEDDEWHLGIWRQRADSTFNLVVNSGELLPGYDSPLYLTGIDESFSINNRGDTVFWATGNTVAETSPGRKQGIWLARANGQKAPIALEGGPVPCIEAATFKPWPIDNFNSLGHQISSALLNGNGDILFAGQFQGPDVTDANDSALWHRNADGTTRLIAREGDIASNGKVFGSFLQGDTSYSLGNAGAVFIQRSGEAIWGYDRRGNLVLVAELGQSIDVDDGPLTDLRTFSELRMLTGSGGEEGARSGFNDRGQIAFYAKFDRSGAGIFLSNAIAVPEPASAALLGVLTLCGIGARHRRRLEAVATCRSLP